ncbi:MAG: hypothetical protein GX275_12270 [Clostridiales bacterium]|nr:hypothetical protein [Clostridiales bacterium]
MILICYFEGIKYLIPCIILFAGVVWSSLTLKRHLLKDLLIGGLCPMVSFIISFIVIK